VTPALPFVRWLPQWRQKDVLRADLLAGLTGAIVVLPQGVALPRWPACRPPTASMRR
jgi:MFS superfamily sulfate permease-like transporter